MTYKAVAANADRTLSLITHSNRGIKADVMLRNISK